MKLTHGKILILIGVGHTLASLLPSFFLNQWREFSSAFFFNVSPHVLSGPLAVISFEKEAAFWFVSWGILLVFFGLALDHIEKSSGQVPKTLRVSWFIFSVLSSIMLPVSGFPILVLPQSIRMLVR